MSNRNFDSRVIIQRLQDQVNANNLYKYQQAGQRIISNPQVSNPTSQRIYSYKEGVETTYYTSVYGTVCSSPTGILNLVATGPIIEPITPPPPPPPPPYVYEYWALSLGGPLSEIGRAIATDTNNNVYVTGSYTSNPLELSSFQTVSSGIILMSSFGILANTGSTDAFLVKYNSLGIAQWANSLGGTGSDISNGITTDTNNNIYVTGSYTSNPLQLSSFQTVSSGIILMSSFGILANTGSIDAFVVKYNSLGIAQWATNIGGTDSDISNGITTDTNNNVYITGEYISNSSIISNYSTVSSGIILLSTFGTLLKTGTASDAFVVKYNSSGIAQWATTLTGGSTEIGLSIITDQTNNVYITGRSLTTPRVSISSFSTVSSGIVRMSPFGTLVNTGSNDAFIVKYNSSGIAQWATSLGGTGSEIGLGITTDQNNNVYVTGSYTSNPLRISSFSTVSSGTILMSPFGTLANVSTNTNDTFVVKYNSSGIAQWATSLGGPLSESGLGITTDLNNNVYVTGSYTSNPLQISSFISVSSGTILMSSFGTLANSGSTDAFVVKYNSSGIVQAATSLGGIGSDIGNAISIDTLNNIYVTGQYASNPIQISGFSTVSSGIILMSSFGTLANTGSSDVFVVKMNSSLQMY